MVYTGTSNIIIMLIWILQGQCKQLQTTVLTEFVCFVVKHEFSCHFELLQCLVEKFNLTVKIGHTKPGPLLNLDVDVQVTRVLL